jgi:hypothetical protein
MEDEGEKEGGQHGGPRAAKQSTHQLPLFSFTQKINKIDSKLSIAQLNVYILFEKFHQQCGVETLLKSLPGARYTLVSGSNLGPAPIGADSLTAMRITRELLRMIT